jgi:putative ABC transport system substrate-binding protein
MRRRDLLALFAGAAAFAPVDGQAQQPERVRRVGVLLPFPKDDPLTRASMTAFVAALAHLGWVEGKNIRLDFRFTAGNPALFKACAAELVALAPDAILASSVPAVEALRQQTHTIPIVFVLVVAPVEQGLVRSLAHPGGNITGFSFYDERLMGKWVQMLKEVAPHVVRIAVIFNPSAAPYAPLFCRAIEAAAPSFGITVTLAPVHDDAGIEQAIGALARTPGGGLIVLPESFSVTHRDVIIAAATRHRLPLMGATELFPRAGGLMSYWFDTVAVNAEAASYIDRILRGATPADLPVQQATKISLVINLKTAKALGLTVPPILLAEADEVIE